MNYWAQSVVNSGTNFSWRPVSSGVPQGLIPGLVLFNLLIDVTDDGIEYTLKKSSDERKVCGG